VNPDLELRQVELLVAVADHGGVEGAAAALGLRPEAVPGQVTRVEHLLGAVLFAVEEGVLTPTPAGQRVLGAARSALASAAALRSEVAALRRSARPVRVLTSVLPPGAVAPLLEIAAPDVGWVVRNALSPAAVQAVADGMADLFAGPASGGTDLPPGLVAHHVLTEPVRLLLPRPHLWADARTVPLPVLASDPWAVPAEPALERYLREACAAVGVVPDVPHRPHELHVLAELVANGSAVAAVPACAVPPGAVLDERLVARECRDLPPLEWTVVRRADGPGPDVVRTVVEALRRALAVRVAGVPRRVNAPPERDAGPPAEPLGSAGHPVRFGSVAHPAVGPALASLAGRAAIAVEAVATQERPDALTAAVRRGGLDVALVHDHPYSASGPVEGVAERTLVAAEPMFVAVGPHHPIARRTAVTAAEAGGWGWADAPADPARPSTTTAFWAALGQDPPVVHRFVDPATAVDVLVEHDLMAMAAATSLDRRLRYVRLDHPLASRRLFLVWRPDRVPAGVVDAVAVALQEGMRAVLPRLPHLLLASAERVAAPPGTG
jgi:DNA-binding transcriptional LysR family regulator